MVTPLAAASLFIYLTHFLVYPPIRDAGHPWWAWTVSIAAGMLAWWLWEKAPGMARRLSAVARRRSRHPFQSEG